MAESEKSRGQVEWETKVNSPLEQAEWGAGRDYTVERAEWEAEQDEARRFQEAAQEAEVSPEREGIELER
jgi:hypothetical protein